MAYRTNSVFYNFDQRISGVEATIIAHATRLDDVEDGVANWYAWRDSPEPHLGSNISTIGEMTAATTINGLNNRVGILQDKADEIVVMVNAIKNGVTEKGIFTNA